MNKEKNIIRLRNYYTVSEIVKSFLTGFIFFIVPSGLFVLLFMNIIVLYVPYLLYLLLVLYIVVISISFFANKVIIETLINYQNKALEINYKILYNILVLISVIDISVTFVVGYLIYLYYI